MALGVWVAVAVGVTQGVGLGGPGLAGCSVTFGRGCAVAWVAVAGVCGCGGAAHPVASTGWGVAGAGWGRVGWGWVGWWLVG